VVMGMVDLSAKQIGNARLDATERSKANLRSAVRTSMGEMRQKTSGTGQG